MSTGKMTTPSELLTKEQIDEVCRGADATWARNMTSMEEYQRRVALINAVRDMASALLYGKTGSSELSRRLRSYPHFCSRDCDLCKAAALLDVREGYVCVPKEPSQEMLTAGWECNFFSDNVGRQREIVRDIYKAMLAAAKGEGNG